MTGLADWAKHAQRAWIAAARHAAANAVKRANRTTAESAALPAQKNNR